jgi:hypothetical protein
MTSKKIVSAVLAATTVLWAVGVAALPVAANAQSTSDLQAQIAALLSQIQQLQGQLNSKSSSTTTTTASYSFSKDLTLGSKGADVTALQTLLNSKGYLSVSPTGYFGSLTQAAVSKWQAANGIAPTTGYFGPKSRALVNSMSVSTTTTNNNNGSGSTVTTVTTTAPATGLSVGLASDNPGAGSLITGTSGGAARVPVLAVNFTAGNSGAVTVSGLNFHKTGVLADNSISGAYLTMNGKVIAQYNSISNGVISFSGMNWQIPAGQTQEVKLAIDVAGGLSAGNTTGFSLNAASDVSAWDTNNNAVTSMGSFPMNGNTFTVTSVSNPSLATLSVASSAIGTQVTAGTQGNLVGAWNFSVQNSKIWLEGINFHVIGSANKGDIRNVKLMVNGVQVGSTLSSVGSDGTAYFDASANPGVLNTGSNNVQLFADVVGSPSYNFQFEVLNSYDVLGVDSQYNVPVTVTNTGGTGTQVSIQQGQITVTQDQGTPTGNIAKGQSQITLAKFDFYAAGEAVKVKYLDFELDFTGATKALNQELQNVSLVDDAGGQVGSTINQPPSSNTCSNGGASYVSTSTYKDCFGTSASPINYIIPANTTRVLSLKADVQTTADFSNITAKLSGDTSNLQGLTSSQINSSAAAQGSALTLASSNLTVAANNALGSQNISAGAQNVKIGSYSFTASSAEGVSISNVSVQSNGANFQNLIAKVNGVAFGTTQGTVSSGTIYTFSGSPFTVPAGSTVNVDIYANTLSSASGSVSPATILTGLSGTGLISNAAISLVGGSVNGQNLTFAGTASVQVSYDSTQPPSGNVVMGSTGNTLGVFRFTETSNVEPVKITDLHVVDAVTGTSTVKAAFSNLTLYNGSTPLGTAGTAIADASGTGYIYSFHFANPIIVPQANSISVTLKGDAASWASAGASDNSVHQFQIATTTDTGANSNAPQNNTTSTAVVALGATSNKASTVTLVTAAGNPVTVLRSVVTVSTAALNGTSHNKSNPDAIGTVTFSTNSAGPAALKTLTLTFSGSALGYGSTTFMASGTSLSLAAGANIQLIDASGNNVISAGEATASSTFLSPYSTSTVVWTFVGSSATGTGFNVSAGGSYTFTLRVNDSGIPGQQNISQSLGANIQNVGDVSYWDALDASSTAIASLPTSTVPLTINSVSFPNGQ